MFHEFLSLLFYCSLSVWWHISAGSCTLCMRQANDEYVKGLRASSCCIPVLTMAHVGFSPCNECKGFWQIPRSLPLAKYCLFSFHSPQVMAHWCKARHRILSHVKLAAQLQPCWVAKARGTGVEPQGFVATYGNTLSLALWCDCECVRLQVAVCKHSFLALARSMPVCKQDAALVQRLKIQILPTLTFVRGCHACMVGQHHIEIPPRRWRISYAPRRILMQVNVLVFGWVQENKVCSASVRYKHKQCIEYKKQQHES
jgi:hypothetical protein